MQNKQATLARLVPTVAMNLATSPIVSKYEYPKLEYFSCAGAVLKASHSTERENT
jgi:4-coumarate--CoA ligase